MLAYSSISSVKEKFNVRQKANEVFEITNRIQIDKNLKCWFWPNQSQGANYFFIMWTFEP